MIRSTQQTDASIGEKNLGIAASGLRLWMCEPLTWKIASTLSRCTTGPPMAVDIGVVSGPGLGRI